MTRFTIQYHSAFITYDLPESEDTNKLLEKATTETGLMLLQRASRIEGAEVVAVDMNEDAARKRHNKDTLIETKNKH